MNLRHAGLALLGAAVTSAANAAPATVDQQIRQLEDRVNAAYAANDLPTYFAYYADDLRALYPEGPTTLPAYRAEWMSFIKGGGAIESFRTSDMQIQVSPRGDAAVASYLATVATRTPGKGVETSKFSETDVWFKRAGRWKIVEVHYSENPAAK